MPPLQKVLSAPVRSDSLATQVFGIVKEAIFTGKLKPGETLRELHLARMLQVSQATVREALSQLEQTGLVIRIQNRKTTVASFTREEVSDRLAMRMALEEIAFLKAARLMREADIVELRGRAKDIADEIERADCLAMTMADMRFHHFVWECAASPILAKTLEQLTTPLFAFLNVLHATGLHNLNTGKPHEALVDALCSRREAAIRAAIREHIEGSYQGFLKSGSESLDALLQKDEPPLEPLGPEAS